MSNNVVKFAPREISKIVAAEPKPLDPAAPDLLTMVLHAENQTGEPEATHEEVPYLPPGTPEKTILEMMEKKAKFTLGIAIDLLTGKDPEKRAAENQKRLDEKLRNKNRW